MRHLSVAIIFLGVVIAQAWLFISIWQTGIAMVAEPNSVILVIESIMCFGILCFAIYNLFKELK